MANELSVTVRLTRETMAWVRQTAEEVEQSMSWVIRDVLERARMSDEEGG